MESKTEFEQCSRLIKSEVARFEQERISDFKTSLQRFLDGMIDGQKELIAAWESYQQTLLKGVNKQGQIQQDVPVETNGNHD
jgi:sorting nexin-1/2